MENTEIGGKDAGTLKAQIRKDLDGGIEKIAKFIPDCNTEYTTNIYCKTLVTDCDNLTQAEKDDFTDCIEDRVKRSTAAICELNPDCPTAHLLRYRWDRIQCRNRELEADVRFWFKCR